MPLTDPAPVNWPFPTWKGQPLPLKMESVTMKIKTNELIGAALDWAVAQCGEWDGNTDADLLGYVRGVEGWTYSPSTDWAQGGPIIEREGIALHLWSSEEWIGDMGDWEAKGPTPLIAAMRCYVASQLGDEVEIPEALETAQEAL